MSRRLPPAGRWPVALVDAHGRQIPFGEGVRRLGDLDVAVALRDQAGGTRVEWSVRNAGRDPVRLGRVGVQLSTAAGRVLEHGWQSWSVVRRCDRVDVRRQRRGAPWWRRGMFVADPAAAGRTVSGDQFLLEESGLTGFLSAGSHFGTVTAGEEGVTAWALLDGAVLAGGAERTLDPLWAADGDAGPLYSRFADLWAGESHARNATPAPTGWCSWYRHRAAVTPDDVRRAAGECRQHGLSVVQIDDGYQAAIGDWTVPAPAWVGGTAALAGELSAAGLTPGLWTAPFLVGEGASILEAEPSWVVRDGRGRPLGAMHHPGLWGGWAYALDTTRPAVLDHLQRTFTALVADGFRYLKLDFLYAAALAGRRHDPARTRAEALRMGLDAVREAVGDGVFLLACGCPFGPAVGVVDAMRVSTDVGPVWSEPATVRGYSETQSGLRSSVRASVLRAPLHRRLWINDADCVLLQPDAAGLSDRQRALMVDVVAGTGGFTMLSDELGSYGEGEWRTVERLLDGAAADAPLDLVDPFSDPLVVRSPVSELEVSWRGEGAASLAVSSGVGALT